MEVMSLWEVISLQERNRSDILFCFRPTGQADHLAHVLLSMTMNFTYAKCTLPHATYLLLLKYISQGTWMTQLVEHETLYLGGVSSSPTLGVEIT